MCNKEDRWHLAITPCHILMLWQLSTVKVRAQQLMELPSHHSGNPPHDCALTFRWTEGLHSSERPAGGLVPARFTLRIWSEEEITHTLWKPSVCRYRKCNMSHILLTSCSSSKHNRLDSSKSDNFSSDCLNKKILKISICKVMISSFNFVHYSVFETLRNEQVLS